MEIQLARICNVVVVIIGFSRCYPLILFKGLYVCKFEEFVLSSV